MRVLHTLYVRALECVAVAGDTTAGIVRANRLRLDNVLTSNATEQVDVTPTSTEHGLQVGPTSGLNIRMDGNEIMAVNNGVGSTLLLQKDTGAHVAIGGTGLRVDALRAVGANLSASETTTSTTYTNLATLGPSVTFVGPPSGVVSLRLAAGMQNNTAGAISFMGYNLHVNSTRKDANGVLLTATESDPIESNFGAVADSRAAYVGVTNFTYSSWLADDVFATPGAQYLAIAKYRASAGTATFRHRRIYAQPQP